MNNSNGPSWADHLQALAAAGIITLLVYGFGAAGLLILSLTLADTD